MELLFRSVKTKLILTLGYLKSTQAQHDIGRYLIDRYSGRIISYRAQRSLYSQQCYVRSPQDRACLLKTGLTSAPLLAIYISQ